MAASARPYFVTYKGVRRLVEAASPAAAAHHVVGADIAELRPARSAEVSQWYRGQFPIDIAGQHGKPLTAGVVLNPVAGPIRKPDEAVSQEGQIAAVLVPSFSAGDARDWLNRLKLGAKELAGSLEIFDRMRERGTMELHDFRALRELCPPLIEAIAAGQGVDMTELAMAEGESIDFQDIVTAIATAHQRSLWGSNGAIEEAADLSGAATA